MVIDRTLRLYAPERDTLQEALPLAALQGGWSADLIAITTEEIPPGNNWC